MLASRTGRRALALAAAAVLSVPAAALARTARYMLRITATMNTQWQRPEFSADRDSFHIFWTESHGSETVQFHTRSTPVLVVQSRSFVTFRVGARTLNDPPRDLKASVKINRTSEASGGIHPGPLGGTEMEDPAPLFDCRKRSVPSIVTISHDNGELYVGAEEDELAPSPLTINHCPVLYASDLPTATLPAVGSALPIAELFASGKEIVKSHHTFSGTAPAGTPPFTTKTSVDWQAAFVQIRSGGHS
jgi:hypothetical protein